MDFSSLVYFLAHWILDCVSSSLTGTGYSLNLIDDS
jgi:hypothetical protein